MREAEGIAGVLRGLNSAAMAGDKLGVWNYLSNNSQVHNAVCTARTAHTAQCVRCTLYLTFQLLGLSEGPRAELVEQYLAALGKEVSHRHEPLCLLW